MLAGVLLHVVKTAGPVQRQRQARAHGQRPVRMVQQYAVPLVAAGDDSIPDATGIAGLSAGVVEDHRLVQHKVKASVRGEAGFHHRLAGSQVAVFQIQALCHAVKSLPVALK